MLDRKAAAAAIAVSCALACWRGAAAPEPTSSDGLVYVRIADGSTDIARARISDGAVQEVTATPDRSERWPYWSDGAGRLVFQMSEPGREKQASDLVLWDPVAGRETVLVTTPNREERWPSWSPNGDSLVFAFTGGVPRSGVALTRLAPRAAMLIARGEAQDRFLRPSFSRDGRMLVAQRRSARENDSKIWILAPGASPRAVTSDADWVDTKPFFTRDGGTIVYTRRPRQSRDHDIAGIGVTGGKPHTILGSAANEHSARPSPTRDEIVFVSDEGESSDLFLADLDGGNPRVLWRTRDSNELAPRWSPDGERVVVTSVPTKVADFGNMNAKALLESRVVVLDRDGNVLLETPGAMADWMPPWQ